MTALRALDGVVGGGFNHGGSSVCLTLNILVIVFQFFLGLFDEFLWYHVGGALGVVVSRVVHVVPVRGGGEAVHTARVGRLQTTPSYQKDNTRDKKRETNEK